eukprot:NODE_413_length_9103_cov_0.450911.p3 type:complete len:170 gc:universal NODE_413_length_9103_cov_0.450911:4741-5250(+)
MSKITRELKIDKAPLKDEPDWLIVRPYRLDFDIVYFNALMTRLWSISIDLTKLLTVSNVISNMTATLFSAIDGCSMVPNLIPVHAIISGSLLTKSTIALDAIWLKCTLILVLSTKRLTISVLTNNSLFINIDADINGMLILNESDFISISGFIEMPPFMYLMSIEDMLL